MRAFTIAELLIVIGIIAIFAGVIVFSPTRGQETYKLLNTSEEIEAVLRRAQGLSLAVKDFNGTPPGGGWGVHFDKNENCYIIFADHRPPGSPNAAYDASGLENSTPCDTAVVGPQTERFEHVFFPSSVEVSQLLDAGGNSVSELDIVYRPPLLTTFFNGIAAASGQTAQIVARSKTLNTTKTIMINSVGNVEVQ